MSCAKKQLCHTKTAAKTPVENKKQTASQAVLWHPANQTNHTKKKTKNTKFN
jgi:hypothetical protein